MSNETLQAILKQSVDPSYVPPQSEFIIGRWLFRLGFPYECCTRDGIRTGYLSAQGATLATYTIGGAT